ncbi:hypothetical protein K431DRAFT_345772 [Polychaeton citri CBS 116435]|uniref:Peptidase S33 tripeptidyl aminopeptidase-like C-terminal domain-containing protein n=1 Tax=Polychaeton citri CBS 116435 TaxID=1314669 RepID=A0A9P4Q9H5_9PEZI|nr:hypothetical protein K431DRAFT_345772 [Polychaeton citri CBS 116435]
MDSLTHAKDLEALRIAFDEPLGIYALSWGEQTISQYANLFPDNIRAMVLDGIVDHSVSNIEVEGLLTGDFAIQATARREQCIESGLCWPNATGSDIKNSFQRFVETPLDASMFLELAECIVQAQKGNATCFASRLWSADSFTSPSYPALTPTDLYSSYSAPISITNPLAPILIVNSLYDPVTAYNQALSLHRKIKGSVLLSRNGEGHGSFGFPEARQVMEDYFIDLVLPEPGTVVDHQQESSVEMSFAGSRVSGGSDEVLSVEPSLSEHVQRWPNTM